MAINFKQIPSVIAIPEPKEPVPPRSVLEEILFHRRKLLTRKYYCKPIQPLYQIPKRPPRMYTTRDYFKCARYKPKYCCKHAGNIILDRDVLTKEEHICYLSQPKKSFAAEQIPSRWYRKKIIMPDVTTRIVQLATPNIRTLEFTYIHFAHLMRKRQAEKLKKQLEEKPPVVFTTVNKALSYIHEERRLERVAKSLNARRCRHLKKQILKKQRMQIRRIVCVLFEEMKDFLLNYQFVMDEQSKLCAVILQQIRNFTDKDFVITNNLKDCQRTIANNLTIWINKFIANFEMHSMQPTGDKMRGKVCDQPTTFLPVEDYISLSHTAEEIECDDDDDDFNPDDDMEEYYEEGEFEDE